MLHPSKFNRPIRTRGFRTACNYQTVRNRIRKSFARLNRQLDVFSCPPRSGSQHERFRNTEPLQRLQTLLPIERPKLGRSRKQRNVQFVRNIGDESQDIPFACFAHGDDGFCPTGARRNEPLQQNAVARRKPFRPHKKTHIVNRRDSCARERRKVVLCVKTCRSKPPRSKRKRNKAEPPARRTGHLNPTEPRWNASRPGSV